MNRPARWSFGQFKVFLRVAVVLFAVVVAIYHQLPQYRVFDQTRLEIGLGQFAVRHIDSTSTSRISIEIETESNQHFDAYLLDEPQFAAFLNWSSSGVLVRPDLRYIRYWESVLKVSATEIVLPDGRFHLLIYFSQSDADSLLVVNLKISEFA